MRFPGMLTGGERREQVADNSPEPQLCRGRDVLIGRWRSPGGANSPLIPQGALKLKISLNTAQLGGYRLYLGIGGNLDQGGCLQPKAMPTKS